MAPQEEQLSQSPAPYPILLPSLRNCCPRFKWGRGLHLALEA